MLYDFAWDEFCSFYVEMVKARLQDASTRPVAQRVLAHTLDTLLRLLHPMSPFITEEVWQRLNAAAPQRGTRPSRKPAARERDDRPLAGGGSIAGERSRSKPGLPGSRKCSRGLREVRSRQDIAPKTTIHFSVRCDAATGDAAGADGALFRIDGRRHGDRHWARRRRPPLSAHFTAAGIEVFVDLAEHIDVAAEIARKEKELAKFEQVIAGKEKQLSNEAFVSRAPEEVIAKERAALEELRSRPKHRPKRPWPTATSGRITAR